MKIRLLTYSILLVLAIVAPFILRSPFQRELLVLSGIFAILALSLDIVMGLMGQFSLGHAAFFGIGAYTSALLSLRLGVPVLVGFVAAILATGALGVIVGYVALRRTRGMYLAIVTLGFGVIIWLVACHWYEVTGGPLGLLGLPSPVIAIPLLPNKIVFRSEFSYYYLVLVLLVLVMYFLSRLAQSRFGRAVKSINENEMLADSVGVSPIRYYVIAFTLSAGLAGLSGALYGHHLRVVNPMLFGIYYMFILLIMVIVGGSGTIAGPVLGAILFVWIPEYLPVSDEFRLMIFGVFLLGCVILMPRGVYPALVSLWTRFTMDRAWLHKKGSN